MIDRAKGILMKSQGLTEEEAYALLRKTAMNEKRKIADVAQSVHHGRGAVRMSSTDAAQDRLHPAGGCGGADRRGRQGLCAAEEGLDVELVREVSWSNVRDKLNIGLFDAAHLIAPVAIASSLGLGHVKVPIVAPFGLGAQRQRHHGDAGSACRADVRGATATSLDPMVSATALARVVAAARRAGQRAAHLRHDVPLLHAQLSSALLDGGRRRRSGRGRPAGRAAAALHGREPRQRPCRCFLCRRALEFGGGRSRHRHTSCISSRRSLRAPPRRCWLSRPLGRGPPELLRALVRAHRRGRLRRGRGQPRRGRRISARPTASASRPRSSAAPSTAA